MNDNDILDFGLGQEQEGSVAELDFAEAKPIPVAAPLEGVELEQASRKYLYADGMRKPIEEYQTMLAMGQEEQLKAEILDRSFGASLEEAIVNAAKEGVKDIAPRVVDADTEVHKLYGTALVDDLFKRIREREIDTPDNPDLPRVVDVLNTVATRRAYLQDYAAELTKRTADRSFFGTAGDLLGRVFVPWAMDSVRYRNLLTKEGEAYLPGGDKKEQADWLMNGDFDQRSKVLKENVEKLFQTNPSQAIDFVRSIIEYTSGDEFMTNVMAGVNAATYPGVGMTTKALSKALTSALAHGPSSHITQALLGNTSGAVQQIVQNTAANPTMFDNAMALSARANVTMGDIGEVTRQLPATFDPKTIGMNSSHYVPEAAARILEGLPEAVNRVLGGIDSAIGSHRITDPATRSLMLQEATDVAASRYNLAQDRISAVEWKGPGETLGTETAIIHVNTSRGTPYTSEAKAHAGAKQIGLPKNAYSIIDHGNNEFSIGIIKSFDESSVNVLSSLSVNLDGAGPRAGALDSLRSPSFVADQAVHSLGIKSQLAAANIHEFYKGLLEPISKLNKDSQKALGRLMDYQTTAVDPVTKQIGRNSNTLDDFHLQFTSVNGRAPTEVEATSYFRLKAAQDIELVATNIRLHKEKTRLGIENNAVPITVRTTSGSDIKTKLKIEGKRVGRAPWDETTDDFYSVAIIRGTLDESTPLPKEINRYTSVADRTSILNNLPSQQLNWVQLSPAGRAQYNKYMESIYGKAAATPAPTHVLVVGGVKSIETTPLTLRHIPARAGFHKQLPEGAKMISQPKLDVSTSHVMYNGDENIHMIEPHIAADAVAVQKIVDEYNTLRLMLKDMIDTGGLSNKANMRAFQSAVRASELPYDKASSFIRMFVGRNATLDVNTPISVRGINSTVGAETDLRNLYPDRVFTSENSSYFNLYKDSLDLSYTSERGADIYSLTRTNYVQPKYSLVPQSTMDPGLVMDRSVRRVMNGIAMDDYKIRAVQTWVAKYSDILDANFLKASQSPVDVVMNPVFDKASKAFDNDLYREAMRERRVAIETLGMKSDFHKSVDSLVANAVSTVAKNTPYLGKAASNVVTDVLKWKTIDDPVRFYRNAAFHPMMGLFNPVTFFTNINSLVHIAALSPRNAIPSTGAAFYTTLLRFNDAPAIIKSADAAMSKMGWAKGEFTRAYETGKNAGWFNVGRSHAMLGDFSDASVLTGRVSDALHAGTVFFRKSDEIIRKAAWFTAWRETMGDTATSLAKPSATQLEQMIKRADTLTVNMTSASNATWQRGLPGVSTQFMSYFARLSEQMLSSTVKGGLTPVEKARVALTYSAVYGVPLGVVGTSLGVVYPFHDAIKREAMERGWYTDDSTLSKVLFNGAVEPMLEWVTGEKYAFGERFGPTGNQVFKDLLFPKDNSSPLLGALGGPGAREIAMIGSASLNLVSKALSPVIGREDQVTSADVLDVLNAVSTMRNVTRGYMMLQAGSWLDKYGNELKDASNMDAIVSALTGLQDREIVDVRTMRESNRIHNDYVNEIGKHYDRYMTSALQASSPAEAQKYINRAKILTEGLTPDEVARLFRRAVTGYELDLIKDKLRFNTRMQKGNN